MFPFSLPIIILAAITALVLYRLDLLPWVKKSGDGARLGTGRAALRRNPYSAVSIRSGFPCEQVEKVRGQRYLGAEAPELPLPGCNAPRCHCRYVHHVDRRTGNLDRRRMTDGEPSGGGFSKLDQREGRGRRASDWVEAYRLNVPLS